MSSTSPTSLAYTSLFCPSDDPFSTLLDAALYDAPPSFGASIPESQGVTSLAGPTVQTESVVVAATTSLEKENGYITKTPATTTVDEGRPRPETGSSQY